MEIRQEIKNAIRECGYETLTPVQEAVIPLYEDTKDISVQASTGSGKTAAYLIPLLNRIDKNDAGIRALIISPTRELAMQIRDVTASLSVYTGIRHACIIGGMDQRKQENTLKGHPQILICTPGRLLDLIRQDRVDLSSVLEVVLDEADQLLENGQLSEAHEILKLTPSARVSLYSATMHEKFQEILKEDHHSVVMEEEPALNTSIDACYIRTDNKENTLRQYLKYTDIRSCIVFLNHKNDAAKLAKVLKQAGLLAAPFSSYYDEKKRLRTIRELKEGTVRILISTDAGARGLDIPELSHIIHFDLPLNVDTYIHRSGRTAHQNNTGTSVALLSSEDEATPCGRYILQENREIFLEKKRTYDLTSPIRKEETKTPDVTKILIRAGRKDKIRPKDVIGALCTVYAFEELGALEIQDNYSTVVLLKKEEELSIPDSITIKGKKRKVERAVR